MNTQFIKIACEAFIKRDNLLLLGKRKNCYGEGSWALPGGHVEFGETLYQALIREMYEELDINITQMKLLLITEDIDDSRHYLHFSFLIESFDNEIICKEPDRCEEWKFFHLLELPEPLFKPHQQIIRDGVAKIGLNKLFSTEIINK